MDDKFSWLEETINGLKDTTIGEHIPDIQIDANLNAHLGIDVEWNKEN